MSSSTLINFNVQNHPRSDAPVVKVISWDVDGTLYDSKDMRSTLIKLWLRAIWRPSTWFDIPAILKSQKMVRYIHRNNGKYNSLFKPEVRLLAERAEKKWFKRALVEVGLKPDVREAIEYFREWGFQQIVVSDYRSEYKLKALGIAELFQHTFACENYNELKPSPNIFSIVCDALSIQPQDILHIGDRIDTDGVAAQEAGCHFYHLSASTEFDARLALGTIHS